jgi:hypothetical protein
MGETLARSTLAVIAIFYDEVYGENASDRLPEEPRYSEALLEWASGDGREYIKTQGMIVGRKGTGFEFNATPGRRAHGLVKIGMRMPSNG